jgi:hypothetical protein
MNERRRVIQRAVSVILLAAALGHALREGKGES